MDTFQTPDMRRAVNMNDPRWVAEQSFKRNIKQVMKAFPRDFIDKVAQAEQERITAKAKVRECEERQGKLFSEWSEKI